MINLTTATNRIIYNFILRRSREILRHTVFEQNDDFTRMRVETELRRMLQKEKAYAIQDYNLTILPFDPARPHYMEVLITLWFKKMIFQVFVNVTNEDG